MNLLQQFPIRIYSSQVFMFTVKIVMIIAVMVTAFDRILIGWGMCSRSRRSVCGNSRFHFLSLEQSHGNRLKSYIRVS